MATAKKLAAKKTTGKAPVKAKPPTIPKKAPTPVKTKTPPVKKAAAEIDRADLPATPRSRIASLRPTDTPGVFKNRANVLVDADGVAISFRHLKQADKDRATEVIGRPVESPLDVMLVNAMDPRLPAHVRHAAAKDAAPYIHAKKVAIQGGDTPVLMRNLDDKSTEELQLLKQQLDIIAAAVGAV